MAENKDYKSVDHCELDEELPKKVFTEMREVYRKREFIRKVGFGKAPVITTTDMAKVWISEGRPFTCDHSEEVYANTLKVLGAGHRVEVPTFHTAIGYAGKQQWDLLRWDEKIPMNTLDINSEWLEIDPKLKPFLEEPVIYRKYASNFSGAHLAQTLNFLGVDTLIVMGATSCACVCHMAMDPTGYGFKTIIPEDTIGDHVPGVIEWNLLDMEARFTDVVPVDEVVEYSGGIDSNVYTKHRKSVDQ